MLEGVIEIGINVSHNASGRAHCRICNQIIERGALDIEFRVYHNNEHYHLHCIVRKASEPIPPIEEFIVEPPSTTAQRRRMREETRRTIVRRSLNGHNNNNEDRIR